MMWDQLHFHADEEALEADVRRALVETLYASILSLVMGAFVGAVMSGTIAYYSRNPYLLACSITIALTGALRIFGFWRFRANRTAGNTNSHYWERIYEVGAWIYSGLLGVNVLMTIMLVPNVVLHMVACSLTAGYAVAIAGRNAGRPNIAITQVILSGVPTTIALFYIHNPIYVVLGLSNIALIAASINIVLLTYNGVRTAFVEKHEKAQLAIRYQLLANTDPLTGLDNRLMLSRYLKFALANKEPNERRKIGVFWIDLDHFKEINDTLGHAVGDKVLQEIAKRLKTVVGNEGQASRFGGDEFVLVLPVHDEKAAAHTAEYIVNMLGVPYTDEQYSLDISGSVGVAIEPEGSIDDAALIQNADIALYEAKSSGRHGYAIFDKMMIDHLVKQREMQADLKRAFSTDQFRILYQPIVDIQTREVVSYEALMRWSHPIYGEISPTIFIPIAEQIKMIEPLTQLVMETACKAAATWPDHIKININVSPSMLSTRMLARIIQTSLLNSGLAARRLCLEITESVLLEDNINALIMLKEFQKMGITLSLDDFGTGYSSLSYVCKYSFNSLKIDRSFVSDLKRSSESRAVIDAVIGLGAALDLHIVAEGIETEENRADVEAAGCRYAQGYLFGRPEPADRLYHLVQAEDATLTPTQQRLKLVRASN